jgi:hypothetical protein
MIEELKLRIEELYLKDVDQSVPIYWLTAKTARLIMSKTWLVSDLPVFAASYIFNLVNCCRLNVWTIVRVFHLTLGMNFSEMCVWPIEQ